MPDVIRFRCWKCHRKHAKSVDKIGRIFKCNCDWEIRVPKKDGGKCKVKRLADYVVEAVLCGGGGALLGFLLAIFILSRMPVRSWFYDYWFVPVTTIACGLVGFVGGERAIDWIGDMVRTHERD